MNIESERTDAVGDTLPEANSGTHKLVYIVISVLGLTLIGLGAYSRFLSNSTWLPELCITLGVAVSTPGILSYLYRRYLAEEIKVELSRPAIEFQQKATEQVRIAVNSATADFQDRGVNFSQDVEEMMKSYRSEIELLETAKVAGLYGLFQSRRNALSEFKESIASEDDQIELVGSSLRGLLQDAEVEYEQVRELLRERINQGVRVRFLLTHPIVADLRARQENRRFQDIGKEIVTSLEILLEQWKVNPDNIKLYEGTPTHFGVRTGEAMLVNGYPYMREAFASPCMIVLKGGYIYEHFATSHFAAWNSALALGIPQDLTHLKSELNNFAKSVQSLMSLAEQVSGSATSEIRE